MIKRPKKILRSKTCLQTKSGRIEYLLKRSTGRRTISICIDEKGDVSVSTPYRAAVADIEGFIHQKAKWILLKVKEAKKNQAYLDSKQFDHGHEFLFLGKKYPLYVEAKDVVRSKVDFDGQKWSIIVPKNLSQDQRQALIEKRMKSWYRAQAEEVLGGRIFHYSRIMGIGPKKIAIRTQKRMWGCCDYNTQTIHLNWQIILSPMKVVDYVVVHEMCHLTVPNHSKRFWNKVRQVMPDFEVYKQWLKSNFLEMALP